MAKDKASVHLLEELERSRIEYQLTKGNLEGPQVRIDKADEDLKLLLCQLFKEITGKELKVGPQRTIKPPKKAGTVRGPDDNKGRQLSNRKGKETPRPSS